MEQERYVRLKCVSEKGRLRVKIISTGYSSNANCKFPRNIRIEGKEWEVPATAVKLQGKGKFYYVVGTKELREVQKEVRVAEVFDVMEGGECVVCTEVISEDAMIILSPCGHKCGCMTCMSKLKDCPICRTQIQHRVMRSELE